MSADNWKLVISIVAIVVSIAAAIFAAMRSRHLAGSGFKAAEDLKVDLVALVAALRSIIYKGTAASQDNKARDISVELERVREFQTSPSGYALAALAAKRGSGDEEDADQWRILGLQFADLAGIHGFTETDGSTALLARHWSTEIETTLGGLTLNDVSWMARKVGDLSSMMASLEQTRTQDLVLRAWFKIAEERRAEQNPQLHLKKLLALKAAGTDDPDLEFWIAILTDDKLMLQKALHAGAHLDAPVGQVLERHRDQLDRLKSN